MSVKSDSSSISRRRWQRRRKRTSSRPQPQLPTTYDESRNRVILGAATTLAICVVNFLNFRGYLQKNQSPRRSLLNDVVQHESMSQFIISVDDTASDHDLGILWQEPPFSPAVNKFYQCMGKQLTGKVGIEADGSITTSHIDVEEDWIDRMSKLAFMPTDAFALVKSGQVNDLQVITDQPIMAVKSLLSEKQRGRILGLFRHPVEHMANQLYKIKAEEGQDDTPLLEWMANTTGTQITKESDMIVKKIVGVKPTDSVTITDLKVAMDFVRDYVVVGLMTEQEESLRRFNLAMGWDDHRKNLDCMTGIFDDEESSFEQEPVVAPNSREWNAIAKRTPLDMSHRGRGGGHIGHNC
ncbi:hypothetical protein ACHAW6_008473 [Cyclotella cf. meneghiniana]